LPIVHQFHDGHDGNDKDAGIATKDWNFTDKIMGCLLANSTFSDGRSTSNNFGMGFLGR